ncbi:MAG: hypothetical protein ACR2RA_24745 [Geminicoccaceae bacterium]
MNELVERVELIVAPGGTPNESDAAALLGTVREPAISVAKALELYWGLAKDKTFGKSEDQLRRWRNPRIKAIRNFVEVIGDKPIDQVTRDDMLDFRQYWLERIETEGLTPNSANKDLIHLGDVLKTINRMKRLGLDLPLGELSFKEGEKRSRPPFSDVWIKNNLLAARALDGLNPEARGVDPRHGQYWLSAKRRSGADRRDNLFERRRAAYSHRARRAAAQKPIRPS